MLDLSDNAFTDMSMVTMIDGFKVHPALRHLYLSFNRIGPNGALMVSTALRAMKSKLQSLDLSHNDITDTGAFALAEALNTNELELESLYLANCGIEGPGAIALGGTLKTAEKLRMININDNPVVRLHNGMRMMRACDNTVRARMSHFICKSRVCDACSDCSLRASDVSDNNGSQNAHRTNLHVMQDDDAAHELKEVTKATGKMIKLLTGLGTLNRN